MRVADYAGALRSGALDQAAQRLQGKALDAEEHTFAAIRDNIAGHPPRSFTMEISKIQDKP
jgi:hypothetical protein